jgi:hypothetical protein
MSGSKLKDISSKIIKYELSIDLVEKVEKEFKHNPFDPAVFHDGALLIFRDAVTVFEVIYAVKYAKLGYDYLGVPGILLSAVPIAVYEGGKYLANNGSKCIRKIGAMGEKIIDKYVNKI